MNIKLKIISALLFCMIMCFSCKTIREEYSSDKFIAVDILAGDTFKGLAAKYLHDPDKDWIIREFNRIDSLTPGSTIIIPLAIFNKGGLKANGYQVVPVLNYKGLSSEKEKKGKKTTINELKEQLNYLHSNGYKIISADDLLLFMDYKIQIPEKSVVITWSDDIDSFFELALPVIDTYKFTSTLFINPLKIKDKTTWKRLKEMSQKGVGVQCRVDVLEIVQVKNKGTLKDYFLKIDETVRKAKLIIEKQLNKKCNIFAVNSENNNTILTNLLIKNGYKSAFFESKGENPFFNDKYWVNMSVIDGGLTLSDFRKKTETFHKMDLN